MRSSNLIFQYGNFNFEKIDDFTCSFGIKNNIYSNALISGISLSGTVVIPGYVRCKEDNRQYKVVETAAFSLRDCVNITNVVLPNTLQTINADFLYNTSVTHLIVPSSVKYLRKSSFSGMTQLQSISFQSGSQLELLDGSSFAHSNNLIFVVIPSKVRKIGNKLFQFRTATTIVDLVFCGSNFIGSTNLTTADTNIAISVSSKYLSQTLAGMEVTQLENDTICI